MKQTCNQPRTCNEQLDDCQSATASVAAFYACIEARENIQRKCFRPGDPDYEGHMDYISKQYKGLRVCEKVMFDECF